MTVFSGSTKKSTIKVKIWTSSGSINHLFAKTGPITTLKAQGDPLNKTLGYSAPSLVCLKVNVKYERKKVFFYTEIL